ncbi:hypothetical protein ACMU_06770 [Actibacterium mucosum KCTC 23349]|uniref:50S ribosomal protein L34 n=1 Tax=Actibacterium mucosum KCTC 23349 TaxID=1454373 RepID=A0A037ZJM4_9RHOB|nr:YceD family protein [Actibacterium mucosum]KAJ56640.1 hypothetical protein ACMU_06770 [Actibacterium mucosum KCTC 23349]
MTAHPDHILDIRRFPAGDAQEFLVEPNTDQIATMREELGLNALRKVRFEGRITPAGKADWQLTGMLGATVVQPCVVTLEPVTTRIDEPVARLYTAQADPLPEESEAEMPDDDSREVIPESLNLLTLATEALALALPLYPRADGAELGQAVFAGDGVAPMRDEDAKPFAGLADLKKRLEEGE